VLDLDGIPEPIGWYLAGFTDGEGSFNVSFRPRNDYVLPWKISLCFNISQRDRIVLDVFQRYLRCGTMRQRANGVWYDEVNYLVDLVQHVIPFFERYGFLSAKKQRDFAKFKQLAELISNGRHLTREGVLEVLMIRREMNDGGKRRYGEEEILNRFENPQRPYARPLQPKGKIWSDLHGDMQSTAEMTAPLVESIDQE
jgi:LAGLIDADG endonuclease